MNAGRAITEAMQAQRDRDADRIPLLYVAEQMVATWGRMRDKLAAKGWIDDDTVSIDDAIEQVAAVKPCPATGCDNGMVGGKTGFSYDYPWPCQVCDGKGTVRADT